MHYSESIVYVDESGDHGLSTIDPGYPVFVLSFCIFDKTAYRTRIVPAFIELKFEHFGHDMVVFHEREIRKMLGVFAVLTVPERRRAFLTELSSAMNEADFMIVAAIIDKRALLEKYRLPNNPYDIALTFCMERTFAALKSCGQHASVTPIIVESRGKRPDAELRSTFERVISGANRWGRLPFQLVFADKKTNSTGLQIADLVAHPIGRNVIDPSVPSRAYAIVEKKFRRSARGTIHGYGRKVFPATEKTERLDEAETLCRPG
jgi:hypothetical protein